MHRGKLEVVPLTILLLLAACCPTARSSVWQESPPHLTLQNPVVTRLRLQPRAVTLAPGEQFQLRILINWSDGATIVPALVWSAEGGAVSSRGLYTAGAVAGTYRIIASLESGALTDTTIVTVGGAVVPPPLPPPPDAPPLRSLPSSGNYHEPADFAPIVGRRFDSKGSGTNGRGSGSLPFRAGGSEGWDDVEERYRNITLASDASAPLSPPGILRMLYPPGAFPAGSTYSPGVAQTMGFVGPTYGPRRYRKLYLRTAFRVSANWQGHPTQTNKLIFVRANGVIHMEPIIRLRGVGSGPLILNVDLQGSPRDRRTDTGGLNPNTPAAARSGAFNIERGRWQVLEAIFEVGRSGAANGKLRMWLNGVLTHDYSNIEFEPDPAVMNYWEQIHVAPTWGGQGGRINQLMWLDFDDVYASGAP